MYPRLTTYLKRAWRATVSYTGIGGMPPIEIAGNVLRTETQLKISVRVPPHVDAKAAAEELKQTLEKVPRPFHITYRYPSPYLSHHLTVTFPFTYRTFHFTYRDLPFHLPIPFVTYWELPSHLLRGLLLHVHETFPFTHRDRPCHLPIPFLSLI